MPITAEYPAGGTVRRAPLTSARYVTPEAGDIGKGLQGLAQGAEQAAQEQQRQLDLEDTAAAKQMAVERTAFTTRLLYGDGTPDNPGYYNLNGKAALDAEPDVRRQLEENAADLRGRAGTGQRQEMFSQFLDNDTAQEERRMAGFRGQQVETYNLEMTVGRATGYANRSVAQIVAGDATGSRVSLEAGWNETRDALHLKGLDGDGAYLASRRLEYTTGIHKDVIRLLVAQGRDVEAEAYYTAHAGEMTEGAQADVVGPLRSQAAITSGATEARAAIARFGDDRAAIYAAAPTDDPRRTQAYQATVDRHFQEQAAIKNEAHDNAVLAATNAVYADGTNPATMDLSRLSAGERNALDAAYQERLHGPPVADGSDEYYRMRQIAADDPQAFARALTGSNITGVRVSRSDMEKLWSLKQSIVNGERIAAATRTVDTAYRTAMVSAAPILRSHGYKPSSPAYAAFEANVLRHLDFLDSAGRLDGNAKAEDEAVNFAFLRTQETRSGGAGVHPFGANDPLPRQGTNYLPLDQVERSLRLANPKIDDAGVKRQLDYYIATGGRAVYQYDNIPANIRTQLAGRLKEANGRVPSKFEVEEAFTRYVMTRGQ